MEVVKKYPFETDHLNKGDRVPTEIIENAYQVGRGTREFSFAMMEAIEYVKSCFMERGIIATVVQEKEEIVILTDEKSCGYNDRSFQRGLRKSRRAHARAIGADRSLMTERTQQLHDRNLAVQGAVLSAIAVVRQSFAVPRQRDTPGVLVPKT